MARVIVKRRNFAVKMESGGGTVYNLVTGFYSEEEAERFAASYGWEWVDENGFVWSLFVAEVD